MAKHVASPPSRTPPYPPPDWEILVIVAPNTPLSSSHCLFPNNAKSPAKFSGLLPFTNPTTFKCDMPESVRRRRMFSQPMLLASTSDNDFSPRPPEQLLRWNFLVYDSFSTDNDVVVFAKGVNHRSGYNRKRPVTSSVREVFRCPHPDPSQLALDSYYGLSHRIGISLEIVPEKVLVPWVVYCIPRPNPNTVSLQARPKYFLCSCTMVYNVAKFLRERVMYHSKLGVDNFLLYDNVSDDDLYSVIEELRKEGYNISTLFWVWPKTQEGGFSHSFVYSKWKGLCRWIMYVDVDEFVFSPSWGNQSVVPFPSVRRLSPKEGSRVGQVSKRCLEFGPSGQRRHPVEGVTQGYTCRRKGDHRHKSVVLVDGVDPSLKNVIHHFMVNEKEGFRWKRVSLEEGLVNHYKVHTWDEFKSKFRRRVSAYVRRST